MVARAQGQSEVARLQAELAAERRSAAEKLAVLREAEQEFRDAFQSLSSEALRQNNQSFLDLAKTSLSEFQQTARLDLDGRQKAIEELVHPLKESLSKVDSKLIEVEQNRVGSHSALTEQLRNLHQAQHTLQVETATLARGARSRPEVCAAPDEGCEAVPSMPNDCRRGSARPRSACCQLCSAIP